MSPEWTVMEVAGPTRLELATSGVTGQRSNQLNYDPAKLPLRVPVARLACQPKQARDPFTLACEGWWAVQGSNL